jgi:1-deoxy-D-xylulose-5-phosphate synthase
MALLSSVGSPQALKRLTPAECVALAGEIREFLVDRVAKTGGHLGPNLGAVELTIAVHRVFDSPHDRLLWDTGHQAYVHKMLTGRQDGFDTLRQKGGMSGYPNRGESEHDVIENSHASTALSYADGFAKAFALRGERNRTVVAVVGDGALTGGMCWEALNNIAACKDNPVVIVVNDNGRSYAPTIGGFADHLATLRMTRGYEQALGLVRSTLSRTPVVGPPLFDALHGVKRGIKDVLTPQVLFEDLGLKYLGTVDGHDIEAVESALRRARDFGGPVIVHCVTRKGFGYRPAEDDDSKHLHDVKVIDPETGRPLRAEAMGWTGVFGEEMLAIGEADPSVVAITAAMLQPVGLLPFAQAYPERVFDVGIAEQHAVTSAAGMAMAGLRPVVCIYATFLNRAFDQVLMDAALHELPVTLVLDRAGVTGPDGPSHHGMWDMAILGVVPGLAMAAPRDEIRLRELLREAVARPGGPRVVRFPTGPVGPEIPAVEHVDGVDVLARGESADVLLVAVGAMAPTALGVARRAAAQGIGVTVVDPRWLSPLPGALAGLAAEHRLVVSLEDGVRVGGFGSRLAQHLRESGQNVPVLTFGLPGTFLPHGTRDEVLREAGLGEQELSRAVVEAIAQLPDPAPAPGTAATAGADAADCDPTVADELPREG